MTEETSPLRLRTAALSHRKTTRFRWQPDAAARATLAKALGLQAIAALDFQGEIHPEGREDFRLEGQLAADVVQSCVITLAPVPARLRESVLRRYLAEFTLPDGDEVEMPADDSPEPLPATLDLTDVAAEALALALPPYPRAKGVSLGEAVFGPEGVAPLRDRDLNPFAGLAGLVGRPAPDPAPDAAPDPAPDAAPDATPDRAADPASDTDGA